MRLSDQAICDATALTLVKDGATTIRAPSRPIGLPIGAPPVVHHTDIHSRALLAEGRTKTPNTTAPEFVLRSGRHGPETVSVLWLDGSVLAIPTPSAQILSVGQLKGAVSRAVGVASLLPSQLTLYYAGKALADDQLLGVSACPYDAMNTLARKLACHALGSCTLGRRCSPLSRPPDRSAADGAVRLALPVNLSCSVPPRALRRVRRRGCRVGARSHVRALPLGPRGRARPLGHHAHGCTTAPGVSAWVRARGSIASLPYLAAGVAGGCHWGLRIYYIHVCGPPCHHCAVPPVRWTGHGEAA